MAFTKVATVGEVPPGKAKQMQIQGRILALFNVAGVFFAIDDTCPHRGAPLSEGEVHGTEVICPWHATSFDLITGAHLCPPARSDVKAYKVQLIGDDVQVDLP
jgi:nitrite reductase (NADH) small subunit/3-phenylpropionate/trans-cinnamate dioxygenase ferredoxin subunit